MIKVGVIGAAGYTGAELLRLLVMHPKAELYVITSHSDKGRHCSEVLPTLRGHLDLVFSEHTAPELQECSVVFFATPTAVAMYHVADILQAGVRVIDLSADFRLQNAQQWADWYGQEHLASDLLESAIYGLPEMNREKIAKANLVANPGCYPTAIILGFLPVLELGLVNPEKLIADAKSGVSGAGRSVNTAHLFSECSETLRPYSVEGHRHLPEICQALDIVSERRVGLTFVPHLVPMVRGILASLYADIERELEADIHNIYVSRYAQEAFVDVLHSGLYPDTRSVRGSNFCRIAIHRQGSRLIVFSVIDNLVKGAAGQAIQNMNIMFGYPETMGLEFPALSP